MFVRMYIVYRIACTHVPQHSHVTVVTTNEFFLVLTCVCAISIYVCIDSPVLHPRMSPLMHTLGVHSYKIRRGTYCRGMCG